MSVSSDRKHVGHHKFLSVESSTLFSNKSSTESTISKSSSTESLSLVTCIFADVSCTVVEADTSRDTDDTSDMTAGSEIMMESVRGQLMIMF